MTTVITIACLLCTLCLLGILTFIDLKIRLLPNKYVGGVFALGIIFQIITQFHFISPTEVTLGAITGAGLLLFVRYFANRIYKQDTLGLGDVKLMGAAGVWLGMDHILLAISLGAFAGLIHGLIYGAVMSRRTGEKVNFSTLSIPAGPGFIFGIVTVGVFKFHALPIYIGM
ncbi:MAG: prepilin peptidase [Alphaproteobacteria bacterium]|nr:MAG: prepilin peptidase [Alphaproteobacteria bacterium]